LFAVLKQILDNIRQKDNDTIKIAALRKIRELAAQKKNRLKDKKICKILILILILLYTK